MTANEPLAWLKIKLADFSIDPNRLTSEHRNNEGVFATIER